MIDLQIFKNAYYLTLKKLLDSPKGRNKNAFFHNSKEGVFEKIFFNRAKILNDKKINFSELFSENSEWLEKLYNSNKNSFYVENNQYFLCNSLTKKTCDLLMKGFKEEKSQQNKDYINTSNLNSVNKLDSDEDIENFDLMDGDYVYFKPTKEFDSISFLMNVFHLHNIRYIFNDKISFQNGKKTNKITTNKLEIISYNDKILFPTKYTMICMHVNDTGLICENVVHFCEKHKHSTIYCCNEPTNKHRMQNIDLAEVEEYTELYCYTAKDISTNEDKLFFSIEEIKDTFVTANIIFVGTKRETFPLIVAVKKVKTENQILDEKFLIKDKSSKSFLSDIFFSSKKYLEKYHNIKMFNSNKIVAEFIIFTILVNKYFDESFKMAVFGKSGSGKSIWAKILIPLFTNSFTVVSGNDVTRNRLLGGKSNYMSKMFSSTFSPGFIESHELVILEEMTNQLNSFYDFEKKNVGAIGQNVFSMLKLVGNKGETYDVGIQGSKQSRVKASTVLLGNLEQLSSIRHDYEIQLRKKYKQFNKNKEFPNFKSSWPKYKNILFYLNELNNPPLAKAHFIVRKELGSRNFVTYLPEAEQARLNIMLILEEDKKEKVRTKVQRFLKFNNIIHRKSINEELDEIFNKDISIKLLDKISDYIEDVVLTSENNFTMQTDADLNRHMKEKLQLMSALLVHMNKLYYEEEDLDHLSAADKQLIDYYLLYNYNTLNTAEASCVSLPKILNTHINEDKILEEQIDAEELEKYENKKINIEEQNIFDKSTEVDEDEL